jgi:hypothetical protein
MWRPIHIFDHITAQIFLEWEMFQKEVVEKIKTCLLRTKTFFEKNAAWDNVVKYFIAGKAPDDNMAYELCMLGN